MTSLSECESADCQAVLPSLTEVLIILQLEPILFNQFVHLSQVKEYIWTEIIIPDNCNHSVTEAIDATLTSPISSVIFPFLLQVSLNFNHIIRDFNCICGKKKPGKETTTFISSSDFLQLKLQRNYQATKDFEVLPPVKVMLEAVLTLPTSLQRRSYQLVAVVLHTGTASSARTFGHYQTFVRLKNSTWALCNDGNVKSASLSDVLCSDWVQALYEQRGTFTL